MGPWCGGGDAHGKSGRVGGRRRAPGPGRRSLDAHRLDGAISVAGFPMFQLFLHRRTQVNRSSTDCFPSGPDLCALPGLPPSSPFNGRQPMSFGSITGRPRGVRPGLLSKQGPAFFLWRQPQDFASRIPYDRCEAFARTSRRVDEGDGGTEIRCSVNTVYAPRCCQPKTNMYRGRAGVRTACSGRERCNCGRDPDGSARLLRGRQVGLVAWARWSHATLTCSGLSLRG